MRAARALGRAGGTLVVLVALVALVAAGAPAAADEGAARARVWHVAGEGAEGHGDGNGSEARPWRALGRAVEEARAGDTLVLAAGRHVVREDIHVHKNVTLAGGQGGATVLQFVDEARVFVGAAAAAQPPVHVRVERVHMQHAHWIVGNTSCVDTGVRAAAVDFERCELEDGTVGVQCGTARVHHTHVHGVGRVVWSAVVAQHATVELRHSTLERLSHATADAGAVSMSDATLLVDSCSFEGVVRPVSEGGALACSQCNVTMTASRVAQSEGAVSAVLFHSLSRVTVENSTFVGNRGARGPGALAMSNGAHMDVRGCSFEGNRGAKGGALFVQESAEVTLNDTRFRHNAARESGGAFFALNAAVRVHRCAFLDNLAVSSGGAVMSKGARGFAHVFDSAVTNNTAMYGGGMYLAAPNHVVRNVSFRANVADQSAGALYLSQNNAVLRACHFAHNEASNAGGLLVDNTRGGASDCAFVHNTAHNDGGGQYINGAESSWRMHNVTMANNTAQQRGGCVMLAASAFVNASDCVWAHGTAHRGGCVAHVDGGRAPLFHNVTVAHCHAARSGGCYFSVNSTARFEYSRMHNCSAGVGAGLLLSASTTALWNCSVEHMHASETGGALVAIDNTTLYLTHTNVSDSSAVSGAGVLLEGKGVYGELVDVVVGNNTASDQGGGLFTHKGAALVAVRTHLVNNTARQGGGALDSGVWSFYRSVTVSGNNASFSGGGLQLGGKNATLRHVAIEHNTSPNGGGMACASCNVTMFDMLFARNNASLGGGVFVDNHANVHLRVAHIKYNNATSKGGAIYLNRNVTLAMHRISAWANNATEKGGVLFTEGGLGNNISIHHSGMSHNGAFRGGAIYVESADVLLNHTHFMKNRAAWGGDAYLVVTNTTVENSLFEDSFANTTGGSFALGSSTLEVDNCTFARCISKAEGGALTVDSCNVTLRNSTFKHNEATSAGGAIKAKFSRTGVHNCTFFANAGRTGNGLALFSDELARISHCVFANHTKGKWGGAGVRLVDTKNATIVNSLFANNTAAKGAALLLENSECHVERCNLTFNHANVAGGAVYGSNANVTLHTCALTNNSASEFAGALFLDEGSVTFAHSNVTNSTAKYAGAAVTVAVGTLAEVDSVLDLSNTSTVQGPPVMVHTAAYNQTDCAGPAFHSRQCLIARAFQFHHGM